VYFNACNRKATHFHCGLETVYILQLSNVPFPGFEELQHVLTPKVKGLQLAVEQLQGHVNAVYDLTIAYSNSIDKETGARTAAQGMTGKSKLSTCDINKGLQN